jgi:hypothetical protein
VNDERSQLKCREKAIEKLHDILTVLDRAVGLEYWK